MSTSTFTGTGGLNIFTRWWDPTATEPRAMIVIVHGFNAHSGQYHWVAEQFVADGFAVCALDLPGRGESEGERFYVENFEEYATDVGRLIAIAKTKQRSLPVFLLGHSAGGVVSCLYSLKHQTELAGLICESFAYELPAPDLALAALKGVSHIAPHAHVLKLKNEDFSRDPATVAAMNSDPLIANESQPSQTVAALIRADERLKNGFHELTLPLLILHGSHDKAARPSGSQHFYDLAGSSDKTLTIYDGYLHDPLHDTGKEVVVHDILQWLNRHLR